MTTRKKIQLPLLQLGCGKIASPDVQLRWQLLLSSLGSHHRGEFKKLGICPDRSISLAIGPFCGAECESLCVNGIGHSECRFTEITSRAVWVSWNTAVVIGSQCAVSVLSDRSVSIRFPSGLLINCKDLYVRSKWELPELDVLWHEFGSTRTSGIPSPSGVVGHILQTEHFQYDSRTGDLRVSEHQLTTGFPLCLYKRVNLYTRRTENFSMRAAATRCFLKEVCVKCSSRSEQSDNESKGVTSDPKFACLQKQTASSSSSEFVYSECPPPCAKATWLVSSKDVLIKPG